MDTPTIDWQKYGFKEIRHDSRTYYQREGFPLLLAVMNETLSVISLDKSSLPHLVSSATIPANNQAVVLLLKAFNCPKLP